MNSINSLTTRLFSTSVDKTQSNVITPARVFSFTKAHSSEQTPQTNAENKVPALIGYKNTITENKNTINSSKCDIYHFVRIHLLHDKEPKLALVPEGEGLLAIPQMHAITGAKVETIETDAKPTYKLFKRPLIEGEVYEKINEQLTIDEADLPKKAEIKPEFQFGGIKGVREGSELIRINLENAIKTDGKLHPIFAKSIKLHHTTLDLKQLASEAFAEYVKAVA